MEMRRIVLLLASMALAVLFGSGVALADSPTIKEDCKNGGYAKYGFKNQGQCFKAIKLPPPADTTPPEITVTGPEGTTSDAPATYTLATNEPVTWECSYTFTFPGESSPNTSGTDPCATGTKTWGINQNGTYVFTFKATDAAGYTSTVTKTLILDRAAVKLTTTQTIDPNPPLAGDFVTVTVTSSNEGTGAGGAVVSDAALHFKIPPNHEVVSITLRDKDGNIVSDPEACRFIPGDAIPNEYPDGVAQCEMSGVNLAPGEAVTMEVRMSVTQPGTYEYFAWTGWNTNPMDAPIDLSENESTVTIVVN
jgi:hypothetical protein